MNKLIPAKSLHSAYQTADFRPLIYRLRQANRRSTHLIAVSASDAGAGGRRCAVALALSCIGSADLGNVLLVDMNFPHRSPYADTQKTKAGWLEWLETKTDKPLLSRVQRDPVTGLFFLSRGGGGAALLPQNWERMLKPLRSLGGIVILDCPPWFEGPETAAICAAMDCAVVAIEAGRSRRPLVRQMVEELRQIEHESSMELLGVILNQRRYPIPQWLYRQFF